ncbi:hypothetical protein GCM10018987_54220 [Streptomyces cremeus]
MAELRSPAAESTRLPPRGQGVRPSHVKGALDEEGAGVLTGARRHGRPVRLGVDREDRKDRKDPEARKPGLYA